jgi:hypothetical protein
LYVYQSGSVKILKIKKKLPTCFSAEKKNTHNEKLVNVLFFWLDIAKFLQITAVVFL